MDASRRALPAARAAAALALLSWAPSPPALCPVQTRWPPMLSLDLHRQGQLHVYTYISGKAHVREGFIVLHLLSDG